jgi:proteasome lid subunit RPN8/RPN11
VELPALLLAEMVEHAQAELPNEACGLLVGAAPWSPTGFVPGVNTLASPHHFAIEPSTWLAAVEVAPVVGLMHSHPLDRAWPSESDLRFASNPHLAGFVHVIVSLRDAVVRAFALGGGRCRVLAEVELAPR